MDLSHTVDDHALFYSNEVFDRPIIWASVKGQVGGYRDIGFYFRCVASHFWLRRWYVARTTFVHDCDDNCTNGVDEFTVSALEFPTVGVLGTPLTEILFWELPVFVFMSRMKEDNIYATLIGSRWVMGDNAPILVALGMLRSCYVDWGCDSGIHC